MPRRLALLLALTALAVLVPGGAARGRRAVEEDALRGRPERALSHGRRVAVPPGRGGPGRAPGLPAQREPCRLDARQRAERVERRRRLRRVDEGVDRLVPQGLRAARRARVAGL